jgi:hypothetical protein
MISFPHPKKPRFLGNRPTDASSSTSLNQEPASNLTRQARETGQMIIIQPVSVDTKMPIPTLQSTFVRKEVPMVTGS